MKKLALNIEDLAVESFETSEDLAGRGTVRGLESTGFEIICTCDSDNGTCDESCQGGCGTDYTCNSCNGTCGGASCGLCSNEPTCATGHQIICSC
jgi:hypothetical protein